MKTSSLILSSCFFLINSVMADNAPMSTPATPSVSSAPKVRSSNYMFRVAGEYLYLQAKEEGLEYATSSSFPFASPPAEGVSGSVHRIHPKFHSGYRLGATYFLPLKKGELTAKWMHYEGGHENSASAPAGGVLWPDWVNPNFGPTAASAHAHWNVDLNVFDLQVATAFMQKNILTLKPFAGFRVAWFNQKLNVNYKNITFDNATTEASIFSRNYSRAHGYGICGGLESRWRIWKGFSLFANGAVSLLWTHFKDLQKEKNADGTPRSSLTDNKYETIPVFELIAGLAWEYQWKKLGFEISLGWEEQVWINQNELNRFLSDSNNTWASQGNFSLTGYNFRATLSY